MVLSKLHQFYLFEEKFKILIVLHSLEVIIIRFGFVGAGKLGVSLGKYFIGNSIKVSGYCSKSESSAMDASSFTNTKYYENLESLVSESDAIIISTPDSEIEKVWNSLKELDIKGKLICHCSGSISSDIFSNIDNFGAYAYSIHPMIAISSKYESYKILGRAIITIEGSPKYKYFLNTMFRNLGNEVCFISSKNKAKYHLSAVMASNLVIGLLNKSINNLMECGFSEEKALMVITSLAQLNIKNIGSDGLEESLTGPVERGDLRTIKSHIDCMDKISDIELYKLLSSEVLDVAIRKNNDRNYKEIEDYLGEKL